MAQLICRDLTLGYDGKAVIEGLNFSVNKGDYLCIVGENGSGKSTLMKTLLGLIPSIKGEIIMGDGVSKNGIGYYFAWLGGTDPDLKWIDLTYEHLGKSFTLRVSFDKEAGK